MSTFYFSGIEKRATAEALLSQSAAGMISQLLYSPSLLQACCDMPLVMDSGAYTKELTPEDIADYACLIASLGERCIWYANADCIGDQPRSNRNYDLLLSLLPPHLHERILWIYQYSADIKYLHEGLEKHQHIGIGGLVPIIKACDKERAKCLVLRLAALIQRYRREPHYFGLSVLDIIESLHTYHETFSVDSTTWLAGAKYGVLINATGKQRPATEGGYDFDTSSILRQNIRTMRKWIERPAKSTSSNPYIQMNFLDIA